MKVTTIPNLSLQTKVKAKYGKIRLGAVTTNGRCEFSAYSGTITIGNGVCFKRNDLLVSRGDIRIGDGCAFGPNVCIYDHNHRFDENGIAPGYTESIVEIGKKCWIGAGVTILKGAKIGDGCVIGAGCIVSGEIPPHSLVTMGRDVNIVPINRKEKTNEN